MLEQEQQLTLPVQILSQNRIEITDLEPDVMEEILMFIYTDKSPNLHGMAADLLIAADKVNDERALLSAVLLLQCYENLIRNLFIFMLYQRKQQ